MKKKTKQTLAMLSVAAIAGTMLGACKKHTDNAVTLTVWCSQMDMDIQNNSFLSIDQLANQYLNSSRKTVKAAQENLVSFQEILQNKSQEQNVSGTQDLKFSKHAAVRLENRGIELTDAQLERLNDGARKAGQKGIRDSLVIVDDLAFIVNVPNKTVVTAMNSRETEENVFTNINGAVIM